MKSSESAFGIFSFSRNKNFEAVGIGEYGCESEYSISFCKGSFYVVVESFFSDSDIRNARKEFARYIENNIEEKGGIPEIFNNFRDKNSISNTEKYINGIISLNNILFISDENILDIGISGIGAYREYTISERSVRVILVKYNKNPERIFNNTISFFQKNNDYIDYSREQDIRIWKKNGKYFLLKKVNNYIICVFDVQKVKDGVNIISGLF